MIHAFWYLPIYVTYGKTLVHVRDHVRRFYGNCRTLAVCEYSTVYSDLIYFHKGKGKMYVFIHCHQWLFVSNLKLIFADEDLHIFCNKLRINIILTMRFQLGFKGTCWGESSEWSSVKQRSLNYRDIGFFCRLLFMWCCYFLV